MINNKGSEMTNNKFVDIAPAIKEFKIDVQNLNELKSSVDERIDEFNTLVKKTIVDGDKVLYLMNSIAKSENANLNELYNIRNEMNVAIESLKSIINELQAKMNK